VGCYTFGLSAVIFMCNNQRMTEPSWLAGVGVPLPAFRDLLLRQPALSALYGITGFKIEKAGPPEPGAT
jgi:hypothetical protein